MLSWRIRRQLLFFAFFTIIVLLIVGYLGYKILPGPSCFDGKRNQDEEGIDCGGSCGECLPESAKGLVVLWTRFFEIRPHVYDVAALVENTNITAGASNLAYTFRLIDADGKTITSRRGSTFVLPNELTLLFQSGLDTGIRTPARVEYEERSIIWRLVDEQDLPIRVIKTDRFFEKDRPRLDVTLVNDSISPVTDVYVFVILSDAAGNAIGVGETIVETVRDTATAKATFTWPTPFSGTVADVQVFVRANPFL